jgi:hypothetical protein
MLRAMTDGHDDLVRIGADGVARPVGNDANTRMRAREGSYHVLPGPPGLVVLRGADGAAAARPCILCGEIRSTGGVCDALSFVGNAGYTGELLQLDGAAARSVFCDQGKIVGAESTVEAEHLGEVLYRYGVVSEEQLYACYEEAATARVRVAEAAVTLGFVARDRAAELAARQVEEVLFAVMQAGAGMFYFLDGYDASSLPFPQSLSIATLVQDAGRRIHEARFLRSVLPNDRHVPARSPGRTPPGGQSDPVFALIDGERSLADLCRALGEGEYQVSRAVYALVQSGHVVIGPPHISPTAAVDVCNRAVALILRELDAMDQGDEVRDQLAAYAAEPRVHAQLFVGAGPADDGTFDAQKVVANLSQWQSPADAGEMLPAWLNEYAMHALSLAQPLVRRREHAVAASTSGEIRPLLAQRVARLLVPISSHVPATKAPA